MPKIPWKTPRFRRSVPAPSPKPNPNYIPPASVNSRQFMRPCLVGGKAATFHRWVEDEKAVIKFNSYSPGDYRHRVAAEYNAISTIPAECSLEKLRSFGALIEWPDGTVSVVKPDLLKFVDVDVCHGGKEETNA